jgi:Protein of unknown function (DUF4013)
MSTINPYVPPTGPSSAPPRLPAPPQPGSSLDFGRTLGFFFQDPNWVQKLLIGSLFTILSFFLIGGVFIAGYAVRLLRRAARGETYPLPEWDDLGGMFMEGLSAMAAYLLHILPCILAFGLLAIPIALLDGGEGEGSPAALFVIFPLLIFVLLLFFAVLFYFAAALTRLAVEERFGAAFEVSENLAFLKRNTGNFLMAIVAFIVSNFIAQFGILLLCIGIIPATFWSQCVGAYALGEVAFRDSGRARP